MRRNLSPNELTYLMGRRYELEKKAAGGDRKSKDQSDTLNGDTSAKLANEYRVGEATIKRAAKFSQAVDAIADKCGPEAKSSILSRESKLSKGAVEKVARVAESAVRQHMTPKPVREVAACWTIATARDPRAVRDSETTAGRVGDSLPVY